MEFLIKLIMYPIIALACVVGLICIIPIVIGILYGIGATLYACAIPIVSSPSDVSSWVLFITMFSILVVFPIAIIISLVKRD